MARKPTLAKRLATKATIAYIGLMTRLPLPAARWVGRRLAGLAYYIVPRIRKVGMANLDLAYSDTLTRAEKVRILKGAVENVGIVAAEFSRLPQITRAFADAHVDVVGRENLPSDTGTIIIGAHLGNWEWMAPVMSAIGVPNAEIVRPLDDPELDAMVDGMRTAGGTITIPKSNAGPRILSALGEKCLLGILVDQSQRENAVPTTFFGHRCWSTIGPALLASRTGLPVLPVTCARQPDGRYRIEFGPPIEMQRTGDRMADLVVNTQRCQDAIEAQVRRYPDQWLWFHRRWAQRPRLEAEFQQRLDKKKADRAVN